MIPPPPFSPVHAPSFNPLEPAPTPPTTLTLLRDHRMKYCLCTFALAQHTLLSGESCTSKHWFSTAQTLPPPPLCVSPLSPFRFCWWTLATPSPVVLKLCAWLYKTPCKYCWKWGEQKEKGKEKERKRKHESYTKCSQSKTNRSFSAKKERRATKKEVWNMFLLRWCEFERMLWK